MIISTTAKPTQNTDSYNSDSDDGPSTHVTVITNFSNAPKIDDKTMKRLQNLIAAPHLTSIISST